MCALVEQVDWKDERREGGGGWKITKHSEQERFPRWKGRLPVSAGEGSLWIAGPRCHRGGAGMEGISAALPGVNAGVVWAG